MRSSNHSNFRTWPRSIRLKWSLLSKRTLPWVKTWRRMKAQFSENFKLGNTRITHRKVRSLSILHSIKCNSHWIIINFKTLAKAAKVLKKVLHTKRHQRGRKIILYYVFQRVPKDLNSTCSEVLLDCD